MADYNEDEFDEQEEGEELFEHHRFVADPGQNPLRIDKFLTNRILNASRNKIQDAASAGNIRVNDVPVKANYKVKGKDVITMVMSYPPRDVITSYSIHYTKLYDLGS